MKIMIGADVVPTSLNVEHFEKNSIVDLLGDELSKKWLNSDFRLFNLECPFTKFNCKSKKNGPSLKASLKSFNGIIGLNPSLVCLANNHMMDYGIEGLNDTLKALHNAKIDYIGAGDNKEKSSKSYIINFKNLHLGVYNCCENEFGTAGDEKPGVNGFNPSKTLADIQELSSKVDYAIVIYHGGKEYYRYPSPLIQENLRSMVDFGANLVIAQHSHAVGSHEVYKNNDIIYGQGNFLFNYSDRFNDEYWNNGILIELDLNDKGIKKEISFIPYVTTKTGIKLANKSESDSIIRGFVSRSIQIRDDNLVKSKYTDFSMQNMFDYMENILFTNKWFSKIDRVLFNRRLLIRRMKVERLLKLLNYMQCEAHNELIIEGLTTMISKIESDKKLKRK
jgi:poly-gamma-glutamate synthesis protein (capsule biosynthesis protein)